ncbi:chaplin [Yinghuangia seranimata]|uniref:chaplin n=1 Tax=Yinghuangia seranimata TaxID=408067 RepID=UPI00248BCDE8|nr:chaplin [Yinghuangia seranimata]MDI2131089.1 chaplin [Yinghuangia seranimata]
MVAVAASGALAAAVGGVAHAESGANGAAADSPGVGSGNTVGVPVDVPVNVCGNGLHVVGLLSPVFGNTCANAAPAETAPEIPLPPSETPHPRTMPTPPPPQNPVTPPPVQREAPVAAPAPRPVRLAETGAGTETAALAGAGIAFLLAGTILYRRATPLPA